MDSHLLYCPVCRTLPVIVLDNGSVSVGGGSSEVQHSYRVSFVLCAFRINRKFFAILTAVRNFGEISVHIQPIHVLLKLEEKEAVLFLYQLTQ